MVRKFFENDQVVLEDELWSLLFDDFEPLCRSYVQKFVILKTKINKVVDDVKELNLLEEKVNRLSEDFDKELNRISDITKKYKSLLDTAVYKKIMNQFALRHFDVRKQEKDAQEALKDCFKRVNTLLLKSSHVLYWSRILENGHWFDYKEWPSVESLASYLYTMFNDRDNPSIFIDRIEFEPNSSNVGRKFIYNKKLRTIPSFIKEVKKLLN